MAKEKKNLLETHPELCAQWDYENNNGLRPEDFTYGSSKEINWVLHYYDERTKQWFDFRWPSQINSRTIKKSGCPFIAKSPKVWPGFNDLTTYPEYKHLIEQWDYERNEYGPEHYTKGSNDTVNWKLEHYDERTGKTFIFRWSAKICRRTRPNKSTGCPYISGQEVWVGYNDLTSYPEYEELVSEWDYEKNYPYKPENFTISSNYNAHWKKRHYDERTGQWFDFTWQAYICNRTNKENPTGCPYLAPNPKVWSGFNDLTTYPEYAELVSEWDYKANYPYRPKDFTRSAMYKAHWKKRHYCDRLKKWFEFTWQVSINSRTNKQNLADCPYISGREVWQGYNDLTTYPECKHLVEEWDYEKNYPHRPEDFTISSSYKAHWICPKGHSYPTRISTRTTREHNCPVCCNWLIVPGINDLASHPKYGYLAKEWHPILNGDLKPTMVAPCTDKKVYWLCPKGHTYKAYIGSRTRLGCGCRECSGSAIEKLAYATLRKYNMEFELEYKFKGLGQKRYDIYIEKYKMLIELDGEQHFKEVKVFKGSLKDRIESDTKKNLFALDNQIPILRIPYIYLPGRDKEKIENFIKNFLFTKQVLQEIIDFYSKYEFSNYPDVARKLNEMYAQVGK